jgi:hypothetical protein
MIWLSGVLLALNVRNEGITMQINIKLTGIWICTCLIVAACSSADGEASPTPEPETVLTAAAETANVQLTEMAKPVATTTPLPPGGENIAFTPTSITDLTPEDGSDVIATPASTVATGGLDQAEFSADVTIPDGTDFDPGEGFTKVWQLRNSGTNTWTPEYTFAFFTGEQMSAPAEVSLSANVDPGATVDVSVDMIAPQSVGTYLGYWKMRNPAGEFFDYAVFVQIDVLGEIAAGTALPTSSGSGQVTKVSIQVDDSSPADCPHTFTFTATFTLSEPGTVTYRMEAGSDTPGFTFNLPDDFTGSFGAGTQSVVYYLDIQDDVNGWAQFHILAPNEKISNQASFSLSCGS